MRAVIPIISPWGLLLLANPGRAGNPIIKRPYTADPTALVHDGVVYLYTGHDEAPDKHQDYVMREWLCFSSADLVNWKPEGSPLAVREFKWAARDAWAGDVKERDGEFYFYAPMEHATIPGKAIGVAVSDRPTGPFRDARGSALITNDMTPDPAIGWDDIDPCAFVDDDGQAYLFWGNTRCHYVKLKPNMIETDGPIETVDVARFTEAPWVHKRGSVYYLSYASGWPEKMAYATADEISGPWTFRGPFKVWAGNCNTNHHAIIDFHGGSYFFYHNGGLPNGGSFRRSVCVESLRYNPDGTIQPIHETTEGVTGVFPAAIETKPTPGPPSGSPRVGPQERSPSRFGRTAREGFSDET